MFRVLTIAALAAPAAAFAAQPMAPRLAVAGRTTGVAMTTGASSEEPAFVRTAGDVFITTMRLGTCALMIHHGFDKIQNVDGFSRPVAASMCATMITAVVFHLLNTGG